MGVHINYVEYVRKLVSPILPTSMSAGSLVLVTTTVQTQVVATPVPVTLDTPSWEEQLCR